MKSKMKRITVFCGSSIGSEKNFKKSAKLLGKRLAEQKIEVVYGGAKIGLMGALAYGALKKKGKVVGVLPEFLRSKEVAHEGLTELIIVNSMHERKKIMNGLCDGVIALPGGFGTMEEFFEMLTWGQLGLHRKPIGILNVNGFYDALLELLDTMVEKGFLKKASRKMVLVSDDVDELLNKMGKYKAPKVGKWISKETV